MDREGETPTIQGDMYLFRKPELLERARHSGMGLVANDRPYAFATDAFVVPIVVSEILSVQKHYPVVFSSPDDPVLLAVVGIEGEGNLFVDDRGRWQSGCYIPVYIRSYPFGFAETPDDRVAIVIDSASPAVSDSPAEAFFDGDRLSKATQSKVDLFAQQVAERRKTREFCERIAELGLLSGQQATRTIAGRRENLASYTAIDADRLRGLEAGQLWDVHTRGMLAVIYAHIFSLENWTPLIERLDARRSS